MNTLMEQLSTAFMLVSLVTGQPLTALAEQAETEVEAVEIAVEAPEPTVQDVLLDVCEIRGYGQECAQTLLGMVWVESNNISTAIGDHGKARGYFQIWYNLHKIPIACAEDLVCSADWTITYLERNQYPKYVNYAVQCHNSCNAGNGYDAKVARHGARLWNEPLAIEQAAPIDLAQLGTELAMK